MQSINLPLAQLSPSSWNANRMDDVALGRLRESLIRYGIVQNLVVRPIGEGNYEVLSGNQRLQVLRVLGYAEAPCVVADADDSEARLLGQALNHVAGSDNLGLRAEVMREILKSLPQEEVLGLLPETAESFRSLSSLAACPSNAGQ